MPADPFTLEDAEAVANDLGALVEVFRAAGYVQAPPERAPREAKAHPSTQRRDLNKARVHWHVQQLTSDGEAASIESLKAVLGLGDSTVRSIVRALVEEGTIRELADADERGKKWYQLAPGAERLAEDPCPEEES